MKLNDIKISKYRTMADFQCNHCHAVKLAPTLVEADEKLCDEVGKVLPINSGFRCFNHNILVYRDINETRTLNGWTPYKITWASPHIYGMAIDYGHIFEASDKELLERCGFTCLRMGENFSHCDVVPRGQFEIHSY